MTAIKNVYALMLALVIVLSGCFGMAGDDSDAQDSGSDENDDDTSDQNDHSDADNGHQDRTWYSSAGLYQTYWDDGQYSGYYACEELEKMNTKTIDEVSESSTKLHIFFSSVIKARIFPNALR